MCEVKRACVCESKREKERKREKKRESVGERAPITFFHSMNENSKFSI